MSSRSLQSSLYIFGHKTPTIAPTKKYDLSMALSGRVEYFHSNLSYYRNFIIEFIQIKKCGLLVRLLFVSVALDNLMTTDIHTHSTRRSIRIVF